jgi:hypothetical protein
MSTQKRLIGKVDAERIFNNRHQTGVINRNNVGEQYTFRIAGPGNDIDVTDRDGNLVQSVVEPGIVLRKRIFNVTAISAIALANPVIMALAVQAEDAEKAGDAVLADELYNQWLNKTSVSFSVLHPLKPEMANLQTGDRVKAVVTLLTPEENGTKGELITLKDVNVVRATAIGGGPKLSLAELTAKARVMASSPFNQPVIAAPAEATA